MASAHKLLVVEAENRVVGVEEFGVEEDLDAITRTVEELDAADLVENRVVGIVSHVVGDDGRQRVSTEGKDATLEQDLVLGGHEQARVGHLCARLAGVPGGTLK